MTLRSLPYKQQPTVRLLLIDSRLQSAHGKRQDPQRIARWWVDSITGRGRLLTGHADQSRTRGGPRYRQWGFHCPERGWVHWKDFTAPADIGAIGKGCDA